MTDHEPIPDALLSEWRAATEAELAIHATLFRRGDGTYRCECGEPMGPDGCTGFEASEYHYSHREETRRTFIALSRTALPALLEEVERLREVARIVVNPAAEGPHTVRCIEKGWQAREEGCYCQQDPRDPDDVLAEARAILTGTPPPAETREQ